MTENGQPNSQQEVCDVFGELHAQLKNAYFAANPESKDRIRGLEDIVFDIETALDQSDIKSRTNEFAALTVKVKTGTEQLENLKEEIDQVIHDIAVATQVVSAIDKAVSAAAWLMKA
jgi:chromosome segregation ATPase